MGTVIDSLDVTRGGWRNRHSALHLAVASARTCLKRADREPKDVDLLINAGIYRDRNLAEPALAALIQDDLGANPEDPHPDGHGTFSFDVANGTCGVLTALQIVDGFLRSGTVHCGLVVASDADPGHGMSEHFPFAPVGAALLCDWSDDDYGLGRVHWLNVLDDGESFSATVALEASGNMLRFRESAEMDERFAAAGADVANRCLKDAALCTSDVDVIIAAPAHHAYRATLAERLGIPIEKIVVAEDERTHTAALAAGIDRAATGLSPGGRALLVVVGAGITAGAALYRKPPTGR